MYGIHAFDFIVADECHRGYSTGEVSVWRDTLNHFDAIRVGLRDHLVANLSIDEEDFVLMPVFEQAGGWIQANRVFDGKLHELLAELNEAIAA